MLGYLFGSTPAQADDKKKEASGASGASGSSGSLLETFWKKVKEPELGKVDMEDAKKREKESK